jgi:hypothetical protein
MCVDGGNVIARLWVVVHFVRGAISLTTGDALRFRFGRACLAPDQTDKHSRDNQHHFLHHAVLDIMTCMQNRCHHCD